VNQKFTGKERDVETGLDFFGARYMSAPQGRFTSPDPLGGSLLDPQTLNRYAYVRNNPLTFTDPTGMYVCKDGKDGACTSDQDKALEKALDKLRGSKNSDIARAASAYGAAGEKNGVTVGFADLTKKGEDGNVVSTLSSDANGNISAQSDVTINSKATGSAFDAAIGHEGSHVADAQDVVKSGISVDANGNVVAGTNISRYQSEQRAYGVSNAILSSEGVSLNVTCGAFSSCKMGQGTMQGQVPGIVDRILGYAPNGYSSGGRPMSRTNQGGSVVNGVIMNPNTTVPH